MPEDIFANVGDGKEIPVTKRKKSIKKKTVAKRAVGAKKISSRAAFANHAAAVDAALEAIAHEGDGSSDMEVGGHISAFNPSPRFYRTIALSFLICTIILVVAVASMTVGKAVITIKTKPQTITFDAPVSISARSVGGGAVKGIVRSIVIQGNKSASPENGPEELSYATGFVTLINNSKENQTLVATTRLLNKDEILFRLRKSAVVPAGGSVSAAVIADKPGKQNEIGPARFRIPGLSDAKQKLIYAESSAAMTGGTARKAVMTEIDVERATAALTADLLAQAKKQLEGFVVASSTVALAGTFKTNIKEVKNDAKPGAVTSQFTLAMKLEVTGVFYAAADLNSYIAQAIQSNTAYAGATVSPVGQAEITINQLDEKVQTAEVRVKQEWLAKARDYVGLIDKKQLAGLAKEDVVRALKGLEWVDDVRVIFSPGWIKKVPGNGDKVKIEFTE